MDASANWSLKVKNMATNAGRLTKACSPYSLTEIPMGNHRKTMATPLNSE